MPEYILICRQSYGIAFQPTIVPNNPPLPNAYLGEYKRLETFVRGWYWETDANGIQYEKKFDFPEGWYEASEGHYSRDNVYYRYITSPVWYISIESVEEFVNLMYEYELEIINLDTLPDNVFALQMTRNYQYMW